jgi:hypothetical protein
MQEDREGEGRGGVLSRRRVLVGGAQATAALVAVGWMRPRVTTTPLHGHPPGSGPPHGTPDVEVEKTMDTCRRDGKVYFASGRIRVENTGHVPATVLGVHDQVRYLVNGAWHEAVMLGFSFDLPCIGVPLAPGATCLGHYSVEFTGVPRRARKRNRIRADLAGGTSKIADSGEMEAY